MEPVATSSAELPGFEKVNLDNLSEETLTIGDLESRRKQLWLIKVPYEFDISRLSDTTVILNGTQDLPSQISDKGTGKRYETRASKYADKKSCPFNVVVPSEDGDHLKVAKDFSGHLDVMQTVQVPMLIYPPTPPPMYTDVPKGLKARWKPFGHKSPPIIHTKLNEARNGKTLTQFSIEKPEKKMNEKRTRAEKEEEKTRKSPKKMKKIKKEPKEEPEMSSKHKHKQKKKKQSNI